MRSKIGRIFRVEAAKQGGLVGHAYLALGLANVHVDQLRPLDREEVDGALSGYGLCNERLASPCTPLHAFFR